MSAVAPHSVLLTGNNNVTGLTVTFNPSAPATQNGQFGLTLYDQVNAPIWVVCRLSAGVSAVGGDDMQAHSASVYGPATKLFVQFGYGTGFYAGLGSYSGNPPAGVQFADVRGTAPGGWNNGHLFRAGTGAPNVVTVGLSQEGDQYARRDGTPLASAGPGVLYQCTAAGYPGTWQAVY